MFNKLKISTLSVVTIILLLLTTSATAQSKVFAIPMSGSDLNPLASIVTVAKEDGDFIDPVTAIASITDASASNPYLLAIAPGIYELGANQLVMKEYVEIVGAGQHATVLRGVISSPNLTNSAAAVVVGANNASISHLSIENSDDTYTYSVAIDNDEASPRISHITINVVDSGDRQYGIRNDNALAVHISDTTINIVGGDGISYQYGIRNDNISSAIVSNTAINLVDGGGGVHRAIYNTDSSSAVLSDSRINVVGGGGTQYGIRNHTSSNSIISNSTINLSDGSSNEFGVHNSGDSEYAIIRNSQITASTNSIYAADGSGEEESYISNSTLTGSVSGDPKCWFTFLDDGTSLSDSCAP